MEEAKLRAFLSRTWTFPSSNKFALACPYRLIAGWRRMCGSIAFPLCCCRTDLVRVSLADKALRLVSYRQQLDPSL
eukprot:750546-Hanusia_phi.AAC.1